MQRVVDIATATGVNEIFVRDVPRRNLYPVEYSAGGSAPPTEIGEGTAVQMAARGPQDAAITGNPEITFFRGTYSKHTPFGICPREIHFGTSPRFGKTWRTRIERSGDLISNMYLRLDLPVLDQTSNGASFVCWCPGVGLAALEYARIYAGGVMLDELRGEFLDALSRLDLKESKRRGYETMTGPASVEERKVLALNTSTYYVPLDFWFCRGDSRSAHNAFPIVNAYNTEIEIEIRLRDVEFLVNSDRPQSRAALPDGPETCLLDVEYVELSEPEKRKFAQSPTYQIFDTAFHQTHYNFTTDYSGNVAPLQTAKIDVSVTQNVREIIWFFRKLDSQRPDAVNGNSHFDYSCDAVSETGPLIRAQLLFNSSPREPSGPKENGGDPMAARFLRFAKPMQHHGGPSPDRHVYLYSASLKPSVEIPSGDINLPEGYMFLDIETDANCIDALVTYLYTRVKRVLRVGNGFVELDV